VFETTLARVVSQVEGALGAAVLSYDGVLIEAVDDSGAGVAGAPVDQEYAAVLKQLTSIGEAVDFGELQAFTIEGADRCLLVRPLSPHYVAVLQVQPDAVLGKGHFYLRVAAPDLAREL
jgi:predicted regulator of Ras-like GTPase activity (Roadblock/LC7/MglB family)